MPRYDFSCSICGARFEQQVPFSGDLQAVTCPKGHRQVRRIYSVPSVVFKGSGWYVTDHRPGGAASPKTESA